MNKSQFQTKLKQLRTKQGLSRQELADRIGCNRSTIWRYENGKINLSLDTLRKYSKVFGIKLINIARDLQELIKETMPEDAQKRAIHKASKIIKKQI